MWDGSKIKKRSFYKKIQLTSPVKFLFVLIVFISCYQLFFVKKDITDKDELLKLSKIEGFYRTSESNEIVPYWWCLGTVEQITNNYINKYTAQIYTPPFDDPTIVYYVQSAKKAAKKHGCTRGSCLEVTPLKVEKWQDTQGTHAMVDFRIQGTETEKPHNVTIELEDNMATEPSITYHDFAVTPAVSQHSKIWFLTTTYKRAENMERFIKSLEVLLHAGESQFGLCLAIFSEDISQPSGEERLGRSFQEKYPQIPVLIFTQATPFKKAPALQKCIDASEISSNDIVFVMDVDITFDPIILQRVKRYVVQGKRVYNPIIWYRNTDESGKVYDGPNGYAMGGTGIIALYKSDILKFGGYDVNRFQEQYGYEDTDFFFRVRYIKLQIARILDRGLEHWPHRRDTWQSYYTSDAELEKRRPVCPDS